MPHTYKEFTEKQLDHVGYLKAIGFAGNNDPGQIALPPSESSSSTQPLLGSLLVASESSLSTQPLLGQLSSESSLQPPGRIPISAAMWTLLSHLTVSGKEITNRGEVLDGLQRLKNQIKGFEVGDEKDKEAVEGIINNLDFVLEKIKLLLDTLDNRQPNKLLLAASANELLQSLKTTVPNDITVTIQTAERALQSTLRRQTKQTGRRSEAQAASASQERTESTDEKALQAFEASLKAVREQVDDSFSDFSKLLMQISRGRTIRLRVWAGLVGVIVAMIRLYFTHEVGQALQSGAVVTAFAITMLS